jgi:dihydroflavonol-4-reductase
MLFVTGGTGLVGAHLLYELIKAGKKVKALKRKSSNLSLTLKIFSYYDREAKDLFDKIEWVEGNILDYFSLEKILEGIDEVYHCAATVSFIPSERGKMIANNVEGTKNLVDASLYCGVKKFCHVSSIAALGRTNSMVPVTEETGWVPSKKNSGYSESKFFSEVEVWRGINEGLNSVIVNPSIILGPGNWDSGSPKIFKTINNGMLFYTKGITGYVDVRDVVLAMILLMDDKNFEDNKNQRYLLNAANLSYFELFNSIANELGKKPPRFYTPDFLLSVVWRMAALAGFIIGGTPFVTRDMVANSNLPFYFDGGKIAGRLPRFRYREIPETIRDVAGFLKKDISENSKAANTQK